MMFSNKTAEYKKAVNENVSKNPLVFEGRETFLLTSISENEWSAVEAFLRRMHHAGLYH